MIKKPKRINKNQRFTGNQTSDNDLRWGCCCRSLRRRLRRFRDRSLVVFTSFRCTENTWQLLQLLVAVIWIALTIPLLAILPFNPMLYEGQHLTLSILHRSKLRADCASPMMATEVDFRRRPSSAYSLLVQQVRLLTSCHVSWDEGLLLQGHSLRSLKFSCTQIITDQLSTLQHRDQTRRQWGAE